MLVSGRMGWQFSAFASAFACIYQAVWISDRANLWSLKSAPLLATIAISALIAARLGSEIAVRSGQSAHGLAAGFATWFVFAPLMTGALLCLLLIAPAIASGNWPTVLDTVAFAMLVGVNVLGWSAPACAVGVLLFNGLVRLWRLVFLSNSEIAPGAGADIPQAKDPN